MNWLRRLFSRSEPSPPALLATPHAGAALQTGQGHKPRPDLRAELFSIRFEHLLVLLNRWPPNEGALKDWDRVAEYAKREKVNPVSAAVELDVNFTPTFWQVALSNEIWNLETCSIDYLEQQAGLFFVQGGDQNFEKEAELICGILVALKRLAEWPPDRPVQLDDCRDFLALSEILPATEDKHILSMLGFVVNHTIALPDYRLQNEDFQFWNSLVRLLERSARSTGDQRNILGAARVRTVLQQRWDLKNQVFQFTSNGVLPVSSENPESTG
jgi:hypothetical protein